MKPLTERQKVLIVNNVVRACNNIDHLNKTGYNFLYLCSGFIAHYSLYGFRAYYNDGPRLSDDIMDRNNFIANMWVNFRPGDPHYEYYAAKADVYRRITKRLLGE
jgi:hypothetical protein